MTLAVVAWQNPPTPPSDVRAQAPGLVGSLETTPVPWALGRWRPRCWLKWCSQRAPGRQGVENRSCSPGPTGPCGPTRLRDMQPGSCE